MNYIITAVIAIITVAGGFFVQDKVAPSVGASQSISSLTELTSLSHNDVLPITDTANATTKKVKWGTATSSMKTVFDSIYSPIFSTSAGLAGLLSDETGSSGGFVRAGSPTITSPVISSLSSLSVGSDATGDIYYRNGSGNFVRLAMPSGSGYYLTGSSTLSIPQWDNNILTNPYSGAMVFNGTTTVSASSLAGNPFILNGLAYKFPSTRGASSSIITSDATGNLMWDTRSGTTTSGTISNNTNTACGLSDTDTDTYVSHYLGDTPSLVTITAEILAKGASGDGTTGGIGTWNSSGTLVNVFTLKKNGGVTTPVYDVTAFTSSGQGNPSEVVTLSIPSATSTGFIFRVSCRYVTSELTSTVSNIKWTATR